jgi:alkylation response protein AidB-like acyl-CoA dehydrogenase
MDAQTKDVLTDEMLARFDERAPLYDRENRSFADDFEELKGSGYLLACVPTEFGGSGLGLDDYSRLRRRLAYAAPATALAVNVHCYWTAVARRAATVLEA